MRKTTFVLFFALPSVLLAEEMIGVVIGGFGGGDSVEVITKDRVCNGYETSPAIPDAPGGSMFGWTAGHQITDNGDDIMILCGGKILEESRLCHSLPMGSDSWRTGVCELTTERMYSSMLTNSEGKIVLTAGYSGRQGWLADMDVLETLNPNCGQNCCDWSESVTEIPGKGVYAHCTVMVDNDLYLIGGNTWDGTVGQYDIGDFWKYSFEQNEWTQLPALDKPRQSMGCIHTTYNGNPGIMVAGGYCHNNPDTNCYQDRIASTIFYDFEQGAWIDLPNLNVPREGLALLNIEGTIMAVGGGYFGSPLEFIEEWNGEKWVNSTLKLSQPRRAFAYLHLPKSYYSC